MKIGITCYPVCGGSGVVATELGIQLARRGHEVHFITYAQPFRLPYYMERIYYHEVDVPTYPLFDYPPYDLALASAMHNTVIKRNLDILHVHYAIPHAVSAWLAKEMGGGRIKVVTTLHGTDITLVGQDPSFFSITRFSIQRSDGLTAVSESLARETVLRFDVPREGIRVIPNFVDLQQYKRDAYPCHRDQLAQPGEKILMHISNFRPVKRVADAVRVLARVNRRIPARLVFIGDGPDRGKAQAVAEEEKIADRVIFLGKQESVAELLSCADLFLLPSESEAFGLVALEAMACGVPVVATAVGGVPEVVPQGVAGLLAPAGDLEEMANDAIYLLEDRERWRQFSAAARITSEAFSAERVIPMYEAYYREILER